PISIAPQVNEDWVMEIRMQNAEATKRVPAVIDKAYREFEDVFGRDLGWLLVWASTAQESLDTTLIAYRVAEDPKVMFPTALAMDGGFLTHSQHMVKIPSQSLVRKFLPAYNLGDRRLHPDNPISIAPQVNEDWVMEIRMQNAEATKRVPAVIDKAYREFEDVFGRELGNPWLEEYMMEDAELAIVGMGTLAMPAKAAVKRLRVSDRTHAEGIVKSKCNRRGRQGLFLRIALLWWSALQRNSIDAL
ncbi:MAG: hypothetical protein HYU03_04575, partial [Thaumarchaeota archaeon]|nr:hypothetical protein [Nitrososphaerota archaeon]